MSDTEDFRTVVTRLRRDRQLSLEELGYRAREWAQQNPAPDGEDGVSLSLIQKRLAPNNDRPPSARLLEALAAALDVAPETFVEYELARARRQFDPDPVRGVGFDRAVENLRALDEGRRRALQEQADELLERARAQSRSPSASDAASATPAPVRRRRRASAPRGRA